MSTKQRIAHLALTAGLLSACAPQSGSDPGTNAARPAAQPGTPTAGQATVIIPGDLIAGATVTDIVQQCPTAAVRYRTDRALAVDPYHPDVVYAGVAGRGLYRSSDGGVTWAPIVSGLRAHFATDESALCFDRFTQLAIDPRDPRHLCVGLRSEADLTVDPPSPAAGVYCTRDSGASWASQLPPALSPEVDAVAIDPAQSDVVVAGLREAFEETGHTMPVLGASVAASSDGGASWSRSELAGRLVPGMEIGDLVIAAGSPTRILAGAPVRYDSVDHPYDGEQYGLLSSADTSRSWVSQTDGMATRMPSRAVRRVAVAPLAGTHVIVTTAAEKGQGGPYAYWSDDAGKSFEMVRGAAMISLDLVAFDPTDRQGLHVLGYDTASGEAWESADGGRSFASRGVELPLETRSGGHIELSAIAWSGDVNVLYLSGSGGAVYRSSDGGHTWVRVLVAAGLPIYSEINP